MFVAIFFILKVVFSFMDIVFLGLDPTERAQTNRLLVKDEFIYNSLYCLKIKLGKYLKDVKFENLYLS